MVSSADPAVPLRRTLTELNMLTVATALNRLSDLRRVQRVPAAAADAQRTEAVGVDAEEGADEVGHAGLSPR